MPDEIVFYDGELGWAKPENSQWFLAKVCFWGDTRRPISLVTDNNFRRALQIVRRNGNGYDVRAFGAFGQRKTYVRLLSLAFQEPLLIL